jgi:hypothetical protein
MVLVGGVLCGGWFLRSRSESRANAGPTSELPAESAAASREAELPPASRSDSPAVAASTLAQAVKSPAEHALFLDTGSATARVAELDDALEDEDADSEKGERLRDSIDDALQGLSTRATVDCGQTFCRIVLEKSLAGGAAWPTIDEALTPKIPGETIFRTEDRGDRSLAYVYTAEPDSHLPLSQPDPADDS